MNIRLRNLRKEDCDRISRAFEEQGWNKPKNQYVAYLSYQESGERDIVVAEFGGAFAGYLTIRWESDYRPFNERGIPEIVDFNVLKKYQRKGIGNMLMDEAERRVKKVSEYVGIGVGVYRDYGPAQVLYVMRGYIPDGSGLVINSMSVKAGEKILIDDGVVMYLTKKL